MKFVKDIDYQNIREKGAFLPVLLCLTMLLCLSSAHGDPRASLRSSEYSKKQYQHPPELIITDESKVPEHARVKPIYVKSQDDPEFFRQLAAQGININPQQNKQPTLAEGYALIAKLFRVPQHNIHLIPRFVEAMERRKQGQLSKEANERKKFLSSNGIIEHLRFDEGEEFAREETMRRDLLTPSQVKLMGDILARNAKDYRVSPEMVEHLDKQSEALMRNATARPLPPCLGGETIRSRKPKEKKNVFSDLYQRKQEEKIFDHLYLPPTAPNLQASFIDATELFGEHINIHRYSTAAGDRNSVLISSGKVACLPFRLRAEGDFIYRDYGENALMNYSEGFHKRGELHPKIEKELDEYF